MCNMLLPYMVLQLLKPSVCVMAFNLHAFIYLCTNMCTHWVGVQQVKFS